MKNVGEGRAEMANSTSGGARHDELTIELVVVL